MYTQRRLAQSSTLAEDLPTYQHVAVTHAILTGSLKSLFK